MNAAIAAFLAGVLFGLTLGILWIMSIVDEVCENKTTKKNISAELDKTTRTSCGLFR